MRDTKVFKIKEFEIDESHIAMYNPKDDLTIIFCNPFIRKKLLGILDKMKIGYVSGNKSIHIKGMWGELR